MLKPLRYESVTYENLPNVMMGVMWDHLTVPAETELSFTMPFEITDDQEQRLYALIEEFVASIRPPDTTE